MDIVHELASYFDYKAESSKFNIVHSKIQQFLDLKQIKPKQV